MQVHCIVLCCHKPFFWCNRFMLRSTNCRCNMNRKNNNMNMVVRFQSLFFCLLLVPLKCTSWIQGCKLWFFSSDFHWECKASKKTKISPLIQVDIENISIKACQLCCTFTWVVKGRSLPLVITVSNFTKLKQWLFHSFRKGVTCDC